MAIGAVVGLAIAAAALLSRPRRSVSQAIPPGVFARGTAGSVDRPVDPTPQLVLGAVLGGAVLVAVALQLPSVLALFVSFLVIGVAAVLPAAGLAALIVLLPHQEPAVLGALGVKLPLLAALGYGLFVRSLAARQVPRLGLGIVAAVGLVGIAAVSAIPTINGLDGERAIVSASRFLPLLAGVAMILVSAWYFLRRDPTPFIVLMLLSVTFACLLALLQLVAGDQPIPLIAGLDAAARPRASRASPAPSRTPTTSGCSRASASCSRSGSRSRHPSTAGSRCCACPSSGSRCSRTLSRGSVAATGIGILAWLWFRNRRLARASRVPPSSFLGLVVAPLLVDARLGEATAAATAAARRACRRATSSASSPWPRARRCSCSTRCSASVRPVRVREPALRRKLFATRPTTSTSRSSRSRASWVPAVYIAAVAALVLAMLRSGSRWRQTSIAMLAVYAVLGLFLEPLTTFQASGACASHARGRPRRSRGRAGRHQPAAGGKSAAGARAAAAPSRTATS